MPGITGTTIGASKTTMMSKLTSARSCASNITGRAGKGSLLLLLLFAQLRTLAQQTIEISGLVTDQERKAPLAGVAVGIKGTIAGAITGSEGAFVLRTKQKLPFTLVFTS